MTDHQHGAGAGRSKASEIAGDELFEPEGLGRALATSLADGTEVSRVGVRSLGADQGYASRVDRVAVEYVPVGAGPATLIIKRSHGDTAEITASAAPFLRGATVYRAFAADRPPIRTPYCYYADVAGDGNAGAFVLEDLGGWTPADGHDGMPPDQLASAARAVARLHAWAWERDDVGLQRLPRDDYPSDQPVVAQWPTIRPYIVKGLGVELAEMGDRFTAGYARVREWLTTRPRTLLHGDYHADNVLLRAGEVAVLDWGMASIGLGAYDVARLASTSAAALPTRESLERAARAWHDELEARGVGDYPWDAAWNDFTVGVALAFPSVFAPLRPEAAPHRAETARRRSLRVGAALRALQIDDPSVPSLTRTSPG